MTAPGSADRRLAPLDGATVAIFDARVLAWRRASWPWKARP